jgi:putative nucleotidyltransferase with HDIG domain
LARATSSALATPDDQWAAGVLPRPEYGVFERMDPRDREHAVRTAQRLLDLHPGAPSVVVRAALLHDCGKSLRPYNVIERVAVGLWAAPSPPPTEGRVPSAAQVRHYHPRLGAELIRAAGGDERVAQLVERHHAPGDDREAALLHEVDGRE